MRTVNCFMQTEPASPQCSGHVPRGTVKPVNFYCDAPNAKSVHVVGDFNDWDPNAHPMERRADGWWFLEVLLGHGHHRYQFLVDGKAMLDPRATGVTFREWSERVSLVAVS
jgi:1,4-alpha-glucan branching enzyme